MTLPVVAYNFYDDDLNIKLNSAPVLAADATFIYQGLASNTVHNLSATAINSAGLESAQSTPLPVRTEGNPTAGNLSGQAAIDALVTAFLEPNTTVDGAIIGISTLDGDYYRAYGGDRTTGLTLTTDYRMRFGSCTKMYTAILILAQVDAGHILLTDTLDMYVSGVPNGSVITIKQLLMMQSGIKDFLQEDPTVQQAYFLTPTANFDPLPYIRSYAPLFTPGTQCSYSNSNYVLLGMILEWCDTTFGAGRDIATIITEDCLQTLGLTQTEWPTGNFMTPLYSRGWEINAALPTVESSVAAAEASLPAILKAVLPSDPLTLVAFLQQVGLAATFGIPAGLQLTPEIEFTAVNPTYAGSAGVLDGTISDFVAFGKAIISGALLSPEMLQLREETFTTYLTYTPAHPWEGPGWMGMGLGVIQFGTWLGWIGNFGGYIAVLFANPTNGAVIAVMMNHAQSQALECFYEISYLLYPETTATVAPWILRPTGIPSAEAFGDLAVFVYEPPGDADGTTQIPHKVPYTI